MRGSTGSLNLNNEIEKVEQRLDGKLERILGRSLKQPFCNTNSGSRKIMQGIQMEQAIQILEPEAPIVSTGYENQLGYASSNFLTADCDYTVLAKISKFSFKPNDHYWLILYNREHNLISVIERTPYHHITEFFGYLFDNTYLDSLLLNDVVRKGSVIKHTISYDENLNRAEGLNMTTMYIACEDVKEDPIVISESAAKRFSSPLISKIEIKINDNDILLNRYGKEKEYKTFPDIGERVENSIICALRREMKDEEALFSQSWDRLKEPMMNDKKFLCDDGKVIDINVYCNNPDKLQNNMYYQQVKKYYDESMRCAKEFVKKVSPFLYNEDGTRKEINVSYELQKLFHNMVMISQGTQYIQDKVFSNISMEIVIQHNKPLVRGDKITDRYGGKGVISKVRPDNMMPHYLKDGRWHPVDVLYSMCTCINRLNDGQLFETSITSIGWKLLEYIKANVKDYDVAFQLIHKYIWLLNPEQADEIAMQYRFNYGRPDPMDDRARLAPVEHDDNQFDRDLFIEEILHDGYIMVSMAPISSNMCIDKLRLIYKEFPFLEKYCHVAVPMIDSSGKARMIYTRRPVVIGYKYIFRLKQLAEEKFSAVSLASTNIRNENSKSRMAKTHNARYASTPVRVYGEMESSTISSHVGAEIFIEEFNLNSSSPEARRLNEQLLTGDPFAFNVRLNEDCVSQSADIVQAFLKVLGERLNFHKVKKFKYQPCLRVVAQRVPIVHKKVAFRVPEELRYKGGPITQEQIEAIEKYRVQQHTIELEREGNSTKLKQIVHRDIGIKEYNEARDAYIAKLKSIGVDAKYVAKIERH